MDEDEIKFPWSLMFFVTAISLIAFSFIIKLLEGKHSRLMLSAAAIVFIAGLFSLVLKHFYRRIKSRKVKRQ